MIITKRPGVVIDITSAPKTNLDNSGVVAMLAPLSLSASTRELTQSDDIDNALFYSDSHIASLIKRMLTSCEKVLLFSSYRTSTSAQATAKLQDDASSEVNVTFSVTAGAMGNSAKLIANATTKTVQLTLVDGVGKEFVFSEATNVDTFNQAMEQLEGVVWIGVEDKTIPLKTITIENFTGGSTGSTTKEDVTLFINKLRTTKFNVVVMPIGVASQDISDVDDTLDQFVQSMRDNEEKLQTYYIGVGTLGSSVGFTNKEYKLLLVNTGLRYSQTERYDTVQSAHILGAMLAGAESNSSLTNKVVPRAIGVTNQLSNSDIERELGNGGTMFYLDEDGAVRLVKEQTTYVDFNADVPDCFTSGLPVREVDHILMQIKADFVRNWLGKRPCTEDSAGGYKGSIALKLLDFETKGYLTNVDVENDIQVEVINRNSFALNLALQPADASEKLYVNCVVR